MESAGRERVRVEQRRSIPPRVAPRFVWALCLLALAGGVYGFGRTALRTSSAGLPDFEYFYKAGASLLQRGGLDPGYDISPLGQVTPRGRIEWYLPFVPRLLTLIAWLPLERAGLVWLVLNVVAVFATLRMVGRYLAGLPPQDWPVTQLLPFFGLWLYWHWEFRLNQINNLTLLLLVGSFVCWWRGRQGAAGLWLGLAVLLKLTPVLLVVWFGLKRQFRVVAVALLTMVLAGPAADMVVLGPSETLDSYRSWLGSAVTRGSQRGLILAQREMDWRNQSVGAVASRWLHPTNYNTRFDNDPRLPITTEVRTVNVAALSRTTVAWLVTAVQGLSLLALLWLGRHPARRLGPWQLRLEWALFMLAMLWFMPVLRSYHVIWAYPLIAVLAGAIHYHGVSHWWSLVAWLALIAVVGGQAAGVWMEAQARGAILAGVVALAVPAIVLLVRLRRRPALLPEHFPTGPHSLRPGAAA